MINDNQRAGPGNPLLEPWRTPFEVPPFERFEPAHFKPAFEQALAAHRAEVEAIAADPDEPSFANTIEALELGGRDLRRVGAVFFNLTGAHTNDALDALQLEMAPVLERHRNAIYLNPDLFARIEALHDRRDALGLTEEQAQVLDRYHTQFVRSGAALAPEAKKRLAEIGERLASLGTKFNQNVLADEKAYALVLDGEADLAGLPDFLREAAAEAASERGHKGKHVITLSRSIIEPFLQFSRRRDLREDAWRAWISRGANGGPTDNRAIAAEMVALRAERARLLGYETFAHFRLADSMAKTPQAARDLLSTVWAPARAQALRERDALQALVEKEGGNFELAPWDWRYYSELRRKAEFDLDENEIKPYFQLDKVIAAAFDVAGRLFGLTFTPRDDIPVYHPDVRAWEVTDASGRLVGVFLGDYFARSSKRSGAWMSGFRSQEKLAGDIRPIIVNVMNFAKAGGGAPTLLSFDDARTLFHEFGHGLHGLLSDVTYPTVSGTSVLRDFVELPSQLYENWLERPEILKRYAVHYRTGEPMPDALLERILATRTYNQGFASVEYLAAALFDIDLHLLGEGAQVDVTAFEAALAKEIGMPDAIVLRHRPTHFAHVFGGDGYSAAYYAYLWAEVLSADAFAAFEEAADVFDAPTATRLKDYVYAAGFSRDLEDAYRGFRGRMPVPDALLKRRGFLAVPSESEL